MKSLPSEGPVLGVQFVGAAGDLLSYADAGYPASAGPVSVPRNFGWRIGNGHRPKRYSRRLRRVFRMSTQTSIIREGSHQDLHLNERSKGCKHVQTVIILGRRRESILWALPRDNRVTPAL